MAPEGAAPVCLAARRATCASHTQNAAAITHAARGNTRPPLRRNVEPMAPRASSSQSWRAKSTGALLARSLGIGITTGQATCHELDGLYQQHQERVGKEHVFGEQHRVVREHRHKRKEQQDRTANRQAHAQFAQRRNGIGHAGSRDDKLSAGIDGKTRVSAVEQRKPQLDARADNGRVHYGMMPVEQHVGVE